MEHAVGNSILCPAHVDLLQTSKPHAYVRSNPFSRTAHSRHTVIFLCEFLVFNQSFIGILCDRMKKKKPKESRVRVNFIVCRTGNVTWWCSDDRTASDFIAFALTFYFCLFSTPPSCLSFSRHISTMKISNVNCCSHTGRHSNEIKLISSSMELVCASYTYDFALRLFIRHRTYVVAALMCNVHGRCGNHSIANIS